MRKNRVRVLTIALILLCATSLSASTPFLQGAVGGIELCPQFICGAAIFVGEFRGTLGNNPFARGSIVAKMKHEELPPANGNAAITGGSWEIKTLLRRVGGEVKSGNIHNNNGDGTFAVYATLALDPPGSGEVTFLGTLNHNTTIPTFGGFVLQ